MRSEDIKRSSQTRIMRALGADSLVDKMNLLETQGKGIFQPTATTSALLQQASKLVEKNMSVLDLGCGWGIIGLEIALELKSKIILSMSDLSENAVSAAQRNAKALGIACTVKLGSLFEPWEGHKFDLIVSDVSGISEQLPFISKWFEDIPIASGVDGLDLVSTVVINANKHLKNLQSKLVMPLISLSNVAKGERFMETHFHNINLLSEKAWHLEIDAGYQMQMDDLKQNGHIDFLKVGNTYEFFTRIYELSGPKGKPPLLD